MNKKLVSLILAMMLICLGALGLAEVHEHVWENSFCYGCYTSCDGHYKTLEGYTLDENGECTICDYVCDHEFNTYDEDADPTACQYCDFVCTNHTYTYENGTHTCTTCAKYINDHEYMDNGDCLYCGHCCDHEWDKSGTPYCMKEFCSYTCPHKQGRDEDNYCTVCGCKVIMVTYVPGEGGSGTPISELRVYPEGQGYAASFALPECMFSGTDGVDFIGWNVNGQTRQPGYWAVLDDEDMIITAQWETKVVMVTCTIDPNNDIEEAFPVEYELGGPLMLPPKEYVDSGDVFVIPDGMMFSHWEIDGVRYEENQEFEVTSGLYIKAIWVPAETNLVMYISGESTFVPENVQSGEHFLLTPEECGFTAPDGQEFDGWTFYMEVSTGNWVNMGYFPEADFEYDPRTHLSEGKQHKFVANWRSAVKDCTITFDYDGGYDNGGESPVYSGSYEAKNGEYIQLPPARVMVGPDGWVLSGWSVDGVVYEPHGWYQVTGDATVEAVWADPATIWYTLEFTPGNNAMGERQTIDVHPGSYVLPQISEFNFAPNEAGMVFAGWRFNGETYPAGATVQVNDNLNIRATWEQGCVISFDANGGEGEMASVTVAMGSEYTLPECGFTAPQYKVFNGWDVNGEVYYPHLTPTVTVTEDLLLKPEWTPLYCTVYFESEGEQVDAYKEMAGEYITLPDPDDMGLGDDSLQFKGWLCSVDERTYRPTQQYLLETDVVTFTAQWEERMVTLTYQDATGETNVYETGPVKYGTDHVVLAPQAAGLTIPTGYKFGGWKVYNTDGDEISETAVVGETMKINSDWSLRPVWVELENYAVTYYPGEGMGDNVYENYTEGETLTLPGAGAFTKEGHTFGGWSDGTNVYAEGATITVNQEMHLTAIWNAIAYTVTFSTELSSPDMTAMDPVTVYYGQEYELPECTMGVPNPSVEFSHWQIGDASYTKGDTITVTGNIEAVAHWKNLKFTVVYQDGEGNTLDTLTNVSFGTKLEFKTPADFDLGTPAGKKFDCWLAYENGKLVGAFHDGDKFPVLGNYTMVPNWIEDSEEPISYKVTYDLAGGKVYDGANETWVTSWTYDMAEGEMDELPPADKVQGPNGAELDHWLVNGKEYGAGDWYVVTGNTTIVAVWKGGSVPTTYTVSFDLGDHCAADAMESKTVEAGEEIWLEDIGKMAQEGYEFLHWLINDEVHEAYTYYQVNSDVTLVAVWGEKPQYTVTFVLGDEADGAIDPITVYAGESIQMPNPRGLEKEEYCFLHWTIGEQILGSGDWYTVNGDVTAYAHWDLIPVKLIYKNTDDTVLKTIENKYGFEHQVYTPEYLGLTAPDGYEFDSWTVYSNNNQPIETNVKPGQTITLYSREWFIKPVWVPVTPVTKYAVTFYPGEGTGEPITEDYYEAGDQMMLGGGGAYGFSKEGCEVAYWSDGTKTYGVGATITVEGDMSLTAIWQPVYYEVTYVAGNGTDETDSAYAPHGSYYLDICRFTAPAGQQFKCWSVDGQEYAPGDTITLTDDVTVTAVWENIPPKYYTITFDKSNENATGTMDPVTVEEGTEFTVPACGFTAVGDVFTRWSDGAKDYNPGDKITVTGNLRLMARWTVRTVTLTYQDENGVATDKKQSGLQYGTTAGTFDPTAAGLTVPQGMRFAGWRLYNTDGTDSGRTIAYGDSFVVDNDWLLRPVWIAVSTVSFDANGAEGAMSSVTVDTGSSYTLPACGFQQPIYENFIGWEIDGVFHAAGSSITVDGDLTAKAVWEHTKYTITFDANGAEGSIDPVQWDAGFDYTLPECSFQPKPYNVFLGWEIDGDLYNEGDELPVLDNMTVKAVWNHPQYTITFDANVPDISIAPVQKLAGEEYTLPKPEAVGLDVEGLNFKGWLVDGEAHGPGYTFTVTRDVTITARWEVRMVTLKYQDGDGNTILETEPVRYGTDHIVLAPEDVPLVLPEDRSFLGWKVYNNKDIEINETAIVGEPLTLYSDWLLRPVFSAPYQYTVSFNADLGSGSMASDVVEHGTVYVLPECTFAAPTGHKFIAWTIGGTGYHPGDEVLVVGNMSFKAAWAPVDVTLTYKPGTQGWFNDVSSVVRDSYYGAQIQLPYLSDIGLGYSEQYSVFLGWNIDGKYYGQGDYYDVYGDTTITAMWADRWYTVTMKDSNAGSASYPVTVEYGKSYTLKDAAAYGFAPKDATYHEFESWKSTSDGKTFMPGDTITGVRSSMTIEAKWKFREVIVVEDKKTGEMVEAPIVVVGQPEPVNPNNDRLMNTSNPDELPEQLGDMLKKLQENTANADPNEGRVVIETMQDVVDALQESISAPVVEEGGTVQEPEYPAENIAVVDIVPVIEMEIDGEIQVIEITSSDMMPDDDGIEVAIQIPAGTNPATHQYKITHMLTQDAWDGSGMKAGDIEELKVHRYDENNLYVRMKNFSPVAVGWKDRPIEQTPAGDALKELPETNDPSSLLGWITLLGASGVGLKAIKRRKK